MQLNKCANSLVLQKKFQSQHLLQGNTLLSNTILCEGF
jgi:hypothetical protein